MENDEPPQWLRNILEQQQSLMAQMAAQQNHTMAVLADRISQLEERPAIPTTPSTIPAPAPVIADRRPKHRLREVIEFDGKDLAAYPQFEGLLRAKVKYDGPAIGEEPERVWYAFGCLKGDAAKRIYPWIAAFQSTTQFTVAGLFEQMGIAFQDPDRQQKALSRLNTIRQGAQPFRSFISEFDRLILEAEGWNWDDRVKKGYVKSAISRELLQHTVAMDESSSYTEFCSQLRRVSDRLAEFKDRHRARPAQNQSTPTVDSNPDPDPMDWERTPAASAAPVAARQRARWVSQDELTRRRNENLCIRCGGNGHFQAQCKLAPASRPKGGRQPALHAAAVQPEARSASPVLENRSSDGSGKE
jgi:hypothetical protein